MSHQEYFPLRRKRPHCNLSWRTISFLTPNDAFSSRLIARRLAHSLFQGTRCRNQSENRARQGIVHLLWLLQKLESLHNQTFGNRFRLPFTVLTGVWQCCATKCTMSRNSPGLNEFKLLWSD